MCWHVSTRVVYQWRGNSLCEHSIAQTSSDPVCIYVTGNQEILSSSLEKLIIVRYGSIQASKK